jgi:hypothetical protein
LKPDIDELTIQGIQDLSLNSSVYNVKSVRIARNLKFENDVKAYGVIDFKDYYRLLDKVDSMTEGELSWIKCFE